ncbi:hypothetical protein PCURB6_38220 [Paenibacillus curdlanolyticus]|nr:hypothetical protein PCURB6_38220 [Paenibacillus curdlanolyticus]
MITLGHVNSFFAVLGFLAFISIMILSAMEMRDERGVYILNKFFKSMFFVLTGSISFLILISAWIDLSYDIYRNIVTLSYSSAFVLGSFILITLRRRN